jgi:hypothetical protein
VDWLGIERRRLGTGMLVFGLVGLVIAAVVAAALIGGAFAARNLDDRLVADQARLAAALDRLSTSMSSLADTVDHAGATLGTSSSTLTDAEAVLDSAAASAQALADSLRISILGSQPFLRASDRLGDLATTLTSFRGRASALAANLDQNAADTSGMAARIRTLQADVDELGERVADLDSLGDIVDLVLGGILLCGLLTAWIAAAAAFCAWAGWRLRRLVPDAAGGA